MQMTRRLQDDFPGVDFNFSQYIEDNVEEAASGVKGENSVKLFGGDLETLEKTANKIKDVMATIPGIADLGVFSSLGQPTVHIDVDRAKAARYGLAPGDINTTIQAAIGGQAAGNCMRTGPTAIFRSWFAWRRNIATVWMRYATLLSARRTRTAAVSYRSH